MDEIVQEFLVESYEALDRLDADLLALEKDPSSKETLQSIFRVMHTIKGTCGFLGFSKLERVAHAAESLLGDLREGSLAVSPPIASALLTTGDALRTMLGLIERTGADGEEDYLHLVATMERLRHPGGAAGPQRVPSVLPVPRKGPADRPKEPVVETGARSDPSPTQAETPAAPTSVTETNIRVDTHVLDNLMTLVGELVLARNHISQITATGDAEPALTAAAQHLNTITSDLQEGVMRTRLQPIHSAWQRFPRVVRDLAIALGKRVRVETEGDDTELDRTLIEAIKDPLMHLVRNAVDHGIETTAEREAAGKPVEGLLRIAASHEGGQVTIKLQDDGHGIDLDKVRARAVERGVLTAEAASRLSTRDAIDMIFRPGFSTADAVTNLSGRGVGMDVVKTNLARIGGTVDVATEAGVGTTYTLKIPLTLAIIPALLVRSGEQRYAIPQVHLLELLRLRPEEIETVHGAPVIRLRDRLLPIVYLASALGNEVAPARMHHVVVLQADDRSFGLVVDAITDSAEIVVKPVDAYLKDVDTFAGATILSEGSIGLILDVLGLARRAHVLTDDERAAFGPTHADDEAEAEADEAALLVFADQEGGRMAIPLELVQRLEEFPRSSLQFSASWPVVEYGTEILHLVDVSRLMLERRHTSRTEGLGSSAGETMPVIIYEHEGRRVGVMVGRIHDVIYHVLTDLEPGSRPGVAGTFVVDGRVTEILDLPQILSEWDEDSLAALSGMEMSA
jgi:two-component system, chemotaxis family, sensor kinase CheA